MVKGVRSSPRVAGLQVALDASDGKTRTVSEKQSERVSSEAGMDMTEEERQAHNAYIEEGGATTMVEEGHWSDGLSVELKSVHDKMQSFLETIRNAQHKKQMEEIIATFKHGVEMNHRRGNEPSGSGASSSNDKHERMVQVAGAQAFQAATVSGEGQFTADAQMAKAMAKREENHAAELAKKVEELQKQHAEALEKAEQQHKKEIVSVAKNAKEEAVKEAEEQGTRSRKKKVEQATEAVMEVETTQATQGQGPSGIALSAAAANGMKGEFLRSQGCEIAIVSKGKGKAKANGKAKAKASEEVSEEDNQEDNEDDNQEDDEEADAKAAAKAAAKAEKAAAKAAAKAEKAATKRKHDSVDDEDAEDAQDGHEKTGSNKKLKAADYYKLLEISGPSKLDTVVKKIADQDATITDLDSTIADMESNISEMQKEMGEKDSDIVMLNKKVAKKTTKVETLTENLKNALRLLKDKYNADKKELLREGCFFNSKRETAPEPAPEVEEDEAGASQLSPGM